MKIDNIPDNTHATTSNSIVIFICDTVFLYMSFGKFSYLIAPRTINLDTETFYISLITLHNTVLPEKEEKRANKMAQANKITDSQFLLIHVASI